MKSNSYFIRWILCLSFGLAFVIFAPLIAIKKFRITISEW